jgi:hypothetical protein
MTDNEFLTAMRIQSLPGNQNCLTANDALAEALRIDDNRSDYCAQLEARIEEQASEIESLRQVLEWERPPRAGGDRR